MNENETKELVVAPKAPAKKKGPAKKVAPVLEPVIAKVVAEVPTYIDPEVTRRRELKEKIARERAHKSQMVTGKFLFNECPGGELKFAYREFPGDQLVNYAMKHDTIHTIPLGVAMHLNDRCAYPEYFHNLDGGKAINAEQMYITTKVHRTNFIPLNFTADVGNFTGNSIAQVTRANPLENRFTLDSLGR